MRPAPASLCLTLALAACAPEDDVAVDTDPVETDDTDVADVLPGCPTFAEGVDVGTVASAAVKETSGLVASRAHPGVWWVHNDSGDAARLYAVGDDGADLGTFTIPGAPALDWEDVTIAPDGDGWSIVVGDIGDNARLRGAVQLWRLPEPDPASPGDVVGAEQLVLTYPDAPHDAEALFADPRTGDLYVVTKDAAGSQVFRAPAPVADGDVFEQVVASVPFGSDTLPGDGLVTGADLSPDGDLVLVRTYFAAYAWRRTASATVAEAFATEPCPVPLASELQGEAIAFEPGGGAYRTIAEGEGATVWRFVRD